MILFVGLTRGARAEAIVGKSVAWSDVNRKCVFGRRCWREGIILAHGVQVSALARDLRAACGATCVMCWPSLLVLRISFDVAALAHLFMVYGPCAGGSLCKPQRARVRRHSAQVLVLVLTSAEIMQNKPQRL